MASEVDICNRALQKLGAARIFALTEDSTQAKACNLAYTAVRDAELRGNLWNFAIKRTQLAALASAPAFGPAYQYQLPTDFLKLVPSPDNDDWVIEGGRILTDDEAPIDVRYIYRVTDTGLYDPAFAEALSARLALELAEALTQSNTKRELAHAEYDKTINAARKANAFAKLPAAQPEDSWITARL